MLHSWMELFIVLLLVLFCFFIYIFPLALHVKIQLPQTLLSQEPNISPKNPRHANQLPHLERSSQDPESGSPGYQCPEQNAEGTDSGSCLSCSKGTPSITTIISALSSFPLLSGLRFSIFFSSVSPISSMFYDLSTIWDSSKSLVYCQLPF